MKNRKFYAIMISVAFVIAVVFSVVLLFTVRKVDVDYSVFGTNDTEAIRNTMDSFIGKNILFLSENDIEQELSSHSDFKVVSVSKALPNKLVIAIEERREVYRLNSGSSCVCMDETGFVIRKKDNVEVNDRSVINLIFEGIDIVGEDCGDYLSTSNDGFFNAVLSMAKNANLTDCIKSITLRIDKSVDIREAVFSTYTGVDIVVDKPDVRGEEKMDKAMAVYDVGTNDYYKTFSQILVLAVDGEITATWTAGG